MNREELAGKLTQFTGKLKEQTGKILEDEGLQTEGKVQNLSGVLLERYGQLKTRVFSKINEVLRTLPELKVEEPVVVEVKI